jgi:hypothetical protein
MPCGRPTPGRPVGRPGVSHPQGVFGGFSYYESVLSSFNHLVSMIMEFNKSDEVHKILEAILRDPSSVSLGAKKDKEYKKALRRIAREKENNLRRQKEQDRLQSIKLQTDFLSFDNCTVTKTVINFR